MNTRTDKTSSPTTYLILDTESIPDGVLLARTKYLGVELTPEEAIARAQAEARLTSHNGSEFLPVTYQVPVAVCVARVATDFRLLSVRCLDVPEYRPHEIVRAFWDGLSRYQAKLVTFNGRSFDLPLMELAAFRYGISAQFQFKSAHGPRYRYGQEHIDLMDLLTNYGAIRLAGGLNLLSKLLGKPGKMEATGGKVYEMYRQGQLQAINEYCTFDVLDTYFVFLRTRVLMGLLSLEQEHQLVQDAKEWLITESAEQPHLKIYLKNWGDWQPWP